MPGRVSGSGAGRRPECLAGPEVATCSSSNSSARSTARDQCRAASANPPTCSQYWAAVIRTVSSSLLSARPRADVEPPRQQERDLPGPISRSRDGTVKLGPLAGEQTGLDRLSKQGMAWCAQSVLGQPGQRGIHQLAERAPNPISPCPVTVASSSSDRGRPATASTRRTSWAADVVAAPCCAAARQALRTASVTSPAASSCSMKNGLPSPRLINAAIWSAAQRCPAHRSRHRLDLARS